MRYKHTIDYNTVITYLLQKEYEDLCSILLIVNFSGSFTFFQLEITDFEMVASTEYPKSDVHDWRKARDIGILGELMGSLVKITKPNDQSVCPKLPATKWSAVRKSIRRSIKLPQHRI